MDYPETVTQPDGVALCGKHLRIYCAACGLDHSSTIPGPGSDKPATDREDDKDVDIEAVPDLVRSSDRDSEVGPELGEGELVEQEIADQEFIGDDIDEDVLLKGLDCYVPPSPYHLPRRLFKHDTGDAFVRFTMPEHFLVYIGAECVDDGTPSARAGCAFFWRPLSHPKGDAIINFRLESQGPTGEEHAQNLERALLRSVDAVLGYRFWPDPGEGARRLTVATDSRCFVTSITSKIWKSVENGSLDRNDPPIRNRDLWQSVLTKLQNCGSLGLRVLFWHINRKNNYEAWRAAYGAILHSDEQKEYRKLENFHLPGEEGHSRSKN